MREFIFLLIFGLITGLVIVFARLSGKKISKKVSRIESEMDELDFVMETVKVGFINVVLPILWVIAVLLIYAWMLNPIRTIVSLNTMASIPIGSIVIAIALFLGFAWMAWPMWMDLQQSRQKIIVKGDTITYCNSQRMVSQITFDEISKVTFIETKNRSSINLYGLDGEMFFTFSDGWLGESLLIKRLIYSGKIPLLETPAFLKNTPYKLENHYWYTKFLENFLNTTTELINFLVKEGLTIWHSFDENGLVEIDFKLYYHDLSEEGQRLFSSNVLDKLFNLPLNDADISDFILFLKTTLIEIRDKKFQSLIVEVY